jgi:hypothetical protein
MKNPTKKAKQALKKQAKQPARKSGRLAGGKTAAKMPARSGKRSGTILWEEKTHKTILEIAIELMRAYANHGTNTHLKDFLTEFYAKSEFTDSMYQGLKDADDKLPWKDNYWASHFYNPESKLNYRGPGYNSPTAYTQAIKYFKLSQHYAQRILHFLQNHQTPAQQLYKNAGYYLGLSLHFFTDLTQPMHAANFTNCWGFEGSYVPKSDLRHAGFEIYVDNAIGNGLLRNLPALQDIHIGPFPDNYVGLFIKMIADRSYETFKDKFRKILEEKGKRVFKWHGLEQLIPEPYWRNEETEPLMESTKIAPYDVANYLTNWVAQSRVKPAYVSKKWYKMEVPANGNKKQYMDRLTNWNEKWMVRYDETAKDNQKFYFIFNADGTVCIGFKDYVHSLWRVTTDYKFRWVGVSDSCTEENLFRIVPLNNNGSEVAIIEATQNDPLMLQINQLPDREGEWRNHYAGYDWAYDSLDKANHHWFELIPGDDMTTGEIESIREHYPNFDKYDWAGSPDPVVAWENKIPQVTGHALFSKVRATKKMAKPKAKARTKPAAKKSLSKTRAKAKPLVKKRVAAKSVRKRAKR